MTGTCEESTFFIFGSCEPLRLGPIAHTERLWHQQTITPLTTF